MKKKAGSFIFVFVLAALAVVAVVLYRTKNKHSSAEGDDRQFAFKDTAAISKIFIADKEGDECTIARTKDGWIVNGKHRARGEAILNLLEAIKHVDVKMPVAKDARQTVLKFMSARALKVEIYAGDEKVKQFYVGHETEDSEGSYMLLTDIKNDKNFDEPYACFIPGFRGFLHPRFIAKENEWRDRVVLNYIPPQVSEISVKHNNAPPDSSFRIEIRDTKTFVLKSPSGQNMTYDEARLKQYLVYFQNLSYERLISRQNEKLMDSLSTSPPFCVITVNTHAKGPEVYRFYRMNYKGKVSPELGVNYNYDPDRFYLNFDNGNEWAIAQYFVFGKLLIGPAYFAPAAGVKK